MQLQQNVTNEYYKLHKTVMANKELPQPPLVQNIIPSNEKRNTEWTTVLAKKQKITINTSNRLILSNSVSHV